MGLSGTGSWLSFVSRRFVEQCNLTHETWLLEPVGTLCNAPITPAGQVATHFTIGNHTAKLSTVAVLDDLPKDVTAGNDWRQAADVTVRITSDNTVLLESTHSDEKPRPTPANNTSLLNVPHSMNASRYHTCVVDIEATMPELPDASHLPEEQANKLREVLAKNATAFTSSEIDIGLLSDIEHSIQLTDEVPVTSAPYRCS